MYAFVERKSLFLPVNDVAQYYAPALSDNSELRRFFVTKNGSIGMGTQHIQEGDVVCILFGGRVPYTLRPANDGSDTWTFVGDAYVDGIMDVRSDTYAIIHARRN